MKKILIAFSVILLCVTAFSQTSVINPKIGFSTASNVNIVKIELSDSATVLSFHTYYSPGNWISIPDQTYIQPDGAKDRFFIKRTEGIPLNQQYTMPLSGEVSYKLIFPPISKTTKKIDYGEGNDGGSWFIYDIQINASADNSKCPKELAGHWFNEKDGAYSISFLDTIVVYKSQLWNLDVITFSKGKGKIQLKNHTGQKELFVKLNKKGICQIGESDKEMVNYTHTSQCKLKPEDKPYATPIFKSDTVIYSGYIKNFTPKLGIKSFIVYVDDIIAGKQNNYLGKVYPNGYFTVKIPMYYPHAVYVRAKFGNYSVYLEPGKDLFQLVDGAYIPLFMGETGKLNSELARLNKINSVNYYELQNKILDMTPATYKAYFQNLQNKDLKALDSVMRTNTISNKAYQIKKSDIEYQYAYMKMEYRMMYENAYRQKNNISYTQQRTLSIKIDTLTREYLDFINDTQVNNPEAVISSSYNSYINRLKYLDILSPGRFSLTTTDIADELEKSGNALPASEKEMIAQLKAERLSVNNPKEKEFAEKYGKINEAFFAKYKDTINILFKIKSGNVLLNLDKYFEERKIAITPEEKEFLAAFKEIQKSKPSVIYADSIKKFHAKYNSFTNQIFVNKGISYRNEQLQSQFGVQQGITTDIMTAQDFLRKIVEELTPVSDKVMENIQKQISTSFIKEYLLSCNKETKAKLLANKSNTGYKVNDVPKTEADSLFDKIISKYKGKVVYVDFWATWCGPCRMGIEQIKPLKEEMDGTKITFVYITGPSSPQNTWSNMIPDIKGEHYRVSDDEWNYLCKKFDVTGIPHYVLVGKNGGVINPNMPHMDISTLKNELERRINE